jgi:hypothetical protein
VPNPLFTLFCLYSSQLLHSLKGPKHHLNTSIMADVNDPAFSPSGAQYLPQLPLDGVKPRGVIPFTPAIALNYKTYLATGTNRSVITSIRRSEMREILRNPHIQWSEEAVPNRAKRARLHTLKAWTLKRFKLDDQQIYRKAETSRGVSYNRRYTVCT